MEHLLSAIDPVVKDFLNLPVFPTGKYRLTLWMFIHALVLLTLLIFFTKSLKRWLLEKVLSRTQFDLGRRYALAAIFSYIVLILGFLVILDTAGIDTTVVTVVAGALGLGVSLSLQTIISSCFAGFFILLERRIKVGDRVQIGDLVGQITDISLRATSLLTNEHTVVIVPNSDFISSRVINLSHNGKTARVSVAITLDRQASPESTVKLLTKIAEEQPGVLKDQPIEVLLKSFTKDQENVNVIVWTQEFAHKPELLQSNLNWAFSKALMEKTHKASTKAKVNPD
jgi:small-conductance mechanosensitive channel